MNQIQMFPATPKEKRRSVLFAIGVITCFIVIVAGISAYTRAPDN